MSSSEVKLERHTSAQSLIAVAPAFFCIMTTALLLHALFPKFVTVHPLYVVLLIVLALFQTVVSDMLYREHSRMTVSEFMISFLIAVVCVILFRDMPFPARLIPGWDIALPLLGAASQIGFTAYIYENLREREIFLAAHERQEGVLLKDESRRNLGLYNGVRDLKRIKTALIFFTLFVSIALLVIVGAGVKPSWLVYLSAGLFMMSFLLSFAGVNSLLEEMERRSEGIIIEPALHRRRFNIATVLVAVCLAGAFMTARDTALLPLSFIKTLMQNFSITGPRFDMQVPDTHLGVIKPPVDDTEVPQGSRETIDLSWLYLIFKILVFIVISAQVAIIIMFLIVPIFSPRLIQKLARGNPFARLLARILSIGAAWVNFIKGFFGLFRHEPRLRSERTSDNAEAMLAGLADKRASIAKRRETNKIIASFLRVIRWGKSHDVPYTLNLAPQEYLTRIEKRFPSLHERLTLIASVFEEAIFSLNLIGDTKTASYYEAVAGVLKYREPKKAAGNKR
ncbi:MAG: hypothetical protein HZC28_11755 [Spirochaetes bacterium]|nr:hypothetical protein [Spirochaetota bacterium]